MRDAEIRLFNSKNNSAKTFHCFIIQFFCNYRKQQTGTSEYVLLQYPKLGMCINTFGNFVVIFLKYPYFLLPLLCNMHAKFQGSGFRNKSYTSSFCLFRPVFFLGPLPASDSVDFCLVRVFVYFGGTADYADHSNSYCFISNVFEVSW